MSEKTMSSLWVAHTSSVGSVLWATLMGGAFSNVPTAELWGTGPHIIRSAQGRDPHVKRIGTWFHREGIPDGAGSLGQIAP